MNARFWIWENDGWIKLTLRHGQSLSWRKYSRHDEGFSVSEYQWSFDGDTVTRYWLDYGTDCDGALSHTGSDACHIGDLASVPAFHYEGEPMPAENLFNGRVICRPAWKESEPTAVYDQFAQAANY